MADPRDVRIHAFTLDEVEVRVLSVPEIRMPEGLSPAECEVARLALDGRSNDEIARTRGTSARTVANQLRAIYRKVGVVTREELAVALIKRA